MLPLALLSTFFWGLSYPLVKLGSNALVPSGSIGALMLFAGIRFLLSGAIIVAWNFARHTKNREIPIYPRGKTLGKVVILALLLTAVHYTLMYLGLANCTGSKSSILKQVGIVFVILTSGIFFTSERLTTKKALGCAVGFAGIIVCNIPFDASFSLPGEGCVILASLSSSAGDLYSKRATRGTDAIFLSGWQQLIGGAILTLVGTMLGGRIEAITVSGVLAYFGLVAASVVAYTLWMWLTKRYDVSRLALIKLTIPLFGVITSAILLGETLFKWQNWVAVALISLGVIIAEHNNKENAV